MAKTNKHNHKPVIDPKNAGLPSTKSGHKSGNDRARVDPQPKPAPNPKKP